MAKIDMTKSIEQQLETMLEEALKESYYSGIEKIGERRYSIKTLKWYNHYGVNSRYLLDFNTREVNYDACDDTEKLGWGFVMDYMHPFFSKYIKDVYYNAMRNDLLKIKSNQLNCRATAKLNKLLEN